MEHLILDFQTLASSTSLLESLEKRKLKYIIVQNVLTKSEILGVIDDLNLVPEKHFMVPSTGYRVFPRTAFDTSNPQEAAEVYFSSTEESTGLIKDQIQTDVLGRFSNLFSKLNGNSMVHVLPGNKKGSQFIPVTFRIMDSRNEDNVTAKIHNGSGFTKRCASTTYKHVMNRIDFDNQLSFFCQLQNCDLGGELTIFEFARVDYPRMSGSSTLEHNNGETVDLSETKQKVTLRLNPGDVVVFPGGQLWHRVEPVKKGNRISVGGFLASNLPESDTDNWYQWS